MAMIFGPKGHFFGVRCGKSEFNDGVIPFSKLHQLFSTYHPDLVSKNDEYHTTNLISFLITLGICHLLTEDEAKNSLHYDPKGVYEFPELTGVSDLPFLPTDPDENAQSDNKILCVVFDGITNYLFSILRKKLILHKDPRYRSFLNSLIVKRKPHNNMELWFQKNDKLYVVVRGKSPLESTTDINRLLDSQVCFPSCP